MFVSQGLDVFFRQLLMRDQQWMMIFLFLLKEGLVLVEKAGSHRCISAGKS